MKKLFALVALVLGVVSCQTDPNDLDVVVGGQQDVMLTVSLPEATRANSANGFQISDLGSTYDLRYILEVYRVDNEGNILYDNCQRQVKRADAATMSFPVRLAPHYKYQIVAWADIVDNGSDADRLYKTTDGLDAIEILSWDAMDETRDAYTGTKYIADFSSASDLSMELTRPFAKVRVVATDINDITALGLSPKAAKVSYLQDMYTKYNAVTAEASAAEAKDHTYTSFPYTDATGEMTLFADYVFVPESGTAKFSLNVYDDEAATRLIKENSFSTEIFVERNKITTIKGDVLTEGGNVSITVDNGLGELETINLVDTAEDLQEIINNTPDGESANITLGGDIDLNDLFGISTLSTRAAATLPIVIAEGKTLELDLNGFKISAPFEEGSTEKHYYAFENRGTFIVKDSKGGGQIIARGNFNYGTMTLESGSIVACDGNGGYGVRNYEGATFVMNGGSISTSLEDDHQVDKGGYDATTLRIDAGATAEINAGIINNICDFTLAIENYGTTTIKGGTFTSVHTTIGNHSTMTIDGGSFTCNGLEGITAHVLWATPGTTTINGGTFDGKDNYNGFNIDAEEGAVVNINGGKFLPVHSGSLYGNGSIVVKGGEFFDDPSERVAAGYKAEQENGVWTVKMTEETKLRKVLAEGGEVTLEEDITIAAQLEVTTTEAIVVNGNNKTINYTGSARAFNVNGLDTANVTLNDLTFVNDASYCQRGINFNVAGKLTLNNVTVGKTGTPATYAINLPGSSVGAEVVINNSYFCGNIALNVWGENATINATGSEFVSYDGTEVENYAAISLNNDGSSIANGTTIYIDGGKVIARDEKGEPSYAVRNSTMTGEVTISDSTEVVGTVSNPVAAVIYEGYHEFYSCSTLKVAIDKAIETKGSVRLIKDIEVDETITIPAEGNVTIDLNGHNITSNIAGKPSESFQLFSVNGNLEIKGNGTISLTSEDFEWNTSYRYTAINIREKGVVTLGNGVGVICEASKDGNYGMSYAVDIYTTGTLNINGASLHSNYIAVRCFFGNSVVNVNSGSKITSTKNNYGIWLQSSPGAVVTIADDVNYTFENNIYCFN